MKIREVAMNMIPILISFAKIRKTIQYGQLAKLVGYGSNQIGKHLGEIDDILNEVKSTLNIKNIPTLNGIVVSKKNGLPSNGFDYVYKQFSSFKGDKRDQFIKEKNEEAANYNWTEILKYLCLNQYSFYTKSLEEEIINKKYSGGEGEKHKKLKEYIYNNPSSIGITKVRSKFIEYKLPSGDCIDVYFELSNETVIAVEVKSARSDSAYLLRGLYQCVKYKSVLLAMNKVQQKLDVGVKSILVIEGKMDKKVQRTKFALNMENDVIEDFHL